MIVLTVGQIIDVLSYLGELVLFVLVFFGVIAVIDIIISFISKLWE